MFREARVIAVAQGFALLFATSAQAATQLGASAGTVVSLRPPPLTSTPNLCSGTDSGGALAVVSERDCAQNVTPAPPGLPPEYTATVSASATVGPNQYPSLAGYAQVTRLARLGPVSANKVDAKATASMLSFLVWNQSSTAPPISSISFEIGISGATQIVSPVGVINNNAGYALSAVAQRGSLDPSNMFEPYFPEPGLGSAGVGKVVLDASAVSFGGNGALLSTSGFSNGAFSINDASFQAWTAGTGVEVWSGVSSDPDLAPTWRSLTITDPMSPSFGLPDTDVQFWLADNGSVDQRFRITLGNDFNPSSMNPPGVPVPQPNITGVLLDFSSTTYALLDQGATFSFSDDIVFHNGLVESKFSNTFEVSELRFFDPDGVDVTDQAGGAFVTSFDEAVAQVVPLPAPGWLLVAACGALGVWRRR